MTMHWGKSLVAAFGVFVLGILALVVFAMSRDVDLVTEHPYERGLGYQKQIGILQRTAALQHKLELRVRETDLVVTFPPQPGGHPSGSIILYRPADRSRDLIIPAETDSSGSQVIPTAALDRGLWRVQVAWEQEGIAFYSEQPIMLY
jgi:hypothetical protein